MLEIVAWIAELILVCGGHHRIEDEGKMERIKCSFSVVHLHFSMVFAPCTRAGGVCSASTTPLPCHKRHGGGVVARGGLLMSIGFFVDFIALFYNNQEIVRPLVLTLCVLHPARGRGVRLASTTPLLCHDRIW